MFVSNVQCCPKNIYYVFVLVLEFFLIIYNKKGKMKEFSFLFIMIISFGECLVAFVYLFLRCAGLALGQFFVNLYIDIYRYTQYNRIVSRVGLSSELSRIK